MFYTYFTGLGCLVSMVHQCVPTIIILDKIPNQDENYILVAPHRTWWDPVYMGFATKPKQFIFMAKKNSLSTVYLVGGFVCGAFPIDREKTKRLNHQIPYQRPQKVIALSS